MDKGCVQGVDGKVDVFRITLRWASAVICCSRKIVACIMQKLSMAMQQIPAFRIQMQGTHI
eukprot:3215419-Pleurochrysis_carterae.AAC.1